MVTYKSLKEKNMGMSSTRKPVRLSSGYGKSWALLQWGPLRAYRILFCYRQCELMFRTAFHKSRLWIFPRTQASSPLKTQAGWHVISLEMSPEGLSWGCSPIDLLLLLRSLWSNLHAGKAGFQSLLGTATTDMTHNMGLRGPWDLSPEACQACWMGLEGWQADG